MRSILFIALVGLLAAGCSDSSAQLNTAQAFPNLTFQQPVDIQNAGDGSGRLFVVEQNGIISVFENRENVNVKKIFLDLTDRVVSGGEMGLLGLAFHPQYKSNGTFFVDYTANNPRRTIISKFNVSSDPDKADKFSETILMQISQPFSNHNGGQISFGPDGYLYISLGDGGSGGDPNNNAQNLSSHLGKILRIDVDKSEAGTNYSVPDDNPFRGNSSGYKEEIYAYGLRNIWRFSFDLTGNMLWAADVGQNAWEEINLIEKGGNYGWRCYEGNHSYNLTGCNSSNYIYPVWEYGHNMDGGYSITGGYVYRGKNAGELTGKYIYGDFVSGNIWALNYADGQADNSILFRGSNSVSTFGIDEQNELYFANYSSGKIYKFVGTPVTTVAKSELPGDYRLHQNFPNPFNPETVISYQLLVGAHVSLKVYNMLGREIAILVDKYQSAGTHNSQFTILHSQLSTGVYFYKIQTGNFSQVKKMIMIK